MQLSVEARAVADVGWEQERAGGWVGMGKAKHRARKDVDAGSTGVGYAQLPVVLGGGVVGVCLYVLLKLVSGCTDASAINYDPRATRDDGSCVGSVYSLSGVYEFHTTAAGADLESGSGGIEFDVMSSNALVKDVKPGSDAWVAEVQVADELLAMRDEISMLVVSGRGAAGLKQAVYKTAEAPIGLCLKQYTW